MPADDRDLGLVHRLLVRLCRRGAVEQLDTPALAAISNPTLRVQLVELAALHGVLGLAVGAIADAVERYTLHPVIRGEIRGLLERLRRRSAMLELVRDEVVGLLHGAQVRPVLLKGAALGYTIYPVGVQRDLRDLDLLVRDSDVETAVTLLQREGYRTPATLPPLDDYRNHHFHIPLYHANSHAVEIHWGLATPGSPFALDAAEMLRSAVPHSANGLGPVLLPSPEQMFLHLVLQNVQEGFSRLARTVDVDRILTAPTRLDWETVARRAAAGGLTSSAALSLQLAQRLLDTPLPREATTRLRPSGAARLHLALMRPVPSLLAQHMLRTHAGHRLLELWLLRRPRERFRLVLDVLRQDAFTEAWDPNRPGLLRRLLSVGKLGVLHVPLYLAGLVACATGAGRRQIRFWSSQASSSDRL